MTRGDPRLRLALWLSLLSVFFVTAAAVDLRNYRPLSGDEMEILSISEKLATQGQLGTDLYAGNFNTDRSWFMNLPGQYLLHLAAFKLAGVGIAQARSVSLIAAVVVLWATGILAHRWYGLAVAGLSTLLLVFWRSGVIAMDLGLPLLSVARSMRYDVTPIMWIWISLLYLDGLLRRPSWSRALAVGTCAAAASLTQFFGATVVPVVGVAWAWSRGRRVLTDPLTAWMCIGFLAVLAPYLTYLATHWTDASSQLGFAVAPRVPPSGPFELMQNVWREPQRYVSLLRPGVGRWLLLVGCWPALAYLVRRQRDGGTPGDRLLLSSLAVPALMLAIFEMTKAPLYAIVLWVPLCVTVAVGAVHAIRWCRARRTPARLGLALLVTGVIGLAIAEGAGTYGYDRVLAGRVSRYGDLGTRIAARVPTGARVVGPGRWWWPLRSQRYLALHALQQQWRAGDADATRARSFEDLMRAHGIGALLIDDEMLVDLRRYPPGFQTQVQAFLDACTTVVHTWRDRTYGAITLRDVDVECRVSGRG